MIIFEGLALGFAYAVPIGSQNIFVINRALKSGLPRSYIIAGAVTAMDVSLSLACLFGAGAFLNTAPSLKPTVLLVGAIYLMYMGIQLLLKHPENAATEATQEKLNLQAVMSRAFLLTWANPQAVIDGTILFGGYRATLNQSEIILFVIGMTSASAIWFFGLTTAVGILRKKISHRVIFSIQVICGLVLLALGTKMFTEFLSGVLK